MPVPLLIVDAFTDRPFAGNPAAVCVLPPREKGSDPFFGDEVAAWMQRVADEMNLSETAFVQPTQEPGVFGLRWFTPAAEVELCGHATLASAHVLWERGLADEGEAIRFETRYSGTLTCRRADDGRIAMDFPADEVHEAVPPDGLIDTLLPGLAGGNVTGVARGRWDWMLECRDEDMVHGARPDFAALAAFECRGVCLTAVASSDPSEPDASSPTPQRRRGEQGIPIRPHADAERASASEASGPPPTTPTARIVSRFFAPRLRVAEDPVTGSIHCALAVYWYDRLGVRRLEAHQASQRGGDLTTWLSDDGTRVELAGHAVTVARGELLADDSI